MRRLQLAPSVLASLAVAAAVVACDNSGVDRGFPPEETGTVVVGIYLDRDGSKNFNPAIDTVFPNARIALLLKGTSDTAKTAASAASGLAIFRNVPLGEYRVAVAQASIGDSLEVGKIDSTDVRLETAPDTVGVDIRLTFPEVSIRRARTLPIGKRVFIRSMVLAGVQSFRDTTSHVVDSSGALRLTRVVLRGGLTGNVPGDSVSVIGVVSTRAGQPTLDQAVLTKFNTRPPPVPVQVSTGTAATASTGVLDANLVQITGGVISDTATVAPDFKVTVSDNSGALVILFDGNLNFVRSNFFPGRRVNAKGVLVPDGLGAWNLKPREVPDVVVF